MRFQGNLIKDGKFWVSHVPALDAMTQGRSRAEAIDMMKDWLENFLAEKGPVEIRVATSPGSNEFQISVSPERVIFPLVLQRQRQKGGFSIREAARLLRFKSHSAYVAYENGEREPSLGQAQQLLTAISGDDALELWVG